MIVAIDGPAGAGKSSVAKEAALAVEFEFLDTGAMYRAITLAAIRQQVEFDDLPALVAMARACKLELSGDTVRLDGTDVSGEIRSPIVTSSIKHVADVPEIRAVLSEQQREFARNRNVVSEGRDQGTEVFPDAECKVFLTASPEERARRRWKQLADQGRPMDYDEILAAQNRRDAEDTERAVGALRIADDATVLTTDGMEPAQVLDEIVRVIRNAIALKSGKTSVSSQQ